jgi:hypothetical protein
MSNVYSVPHVSAAPNGFQWVPFARDLAIQPGAKLRNAPSFRRLPNRLPLRQEFVVLAV